MRAQASWTTRLDRVLLAAALAAGLAAPARADPAGDTRLINTPAEQYAMAPGGVDMRTGTFVFNETDLAIGGDAASGGLALTRTTEPGVAGHANPFGNLSNNWDIMISELRIDFANPAKFGLDYQINVHFGGRSQTYRGRHENNGYEQASAGPYAPLTFTGDRGQASVVYTYQAGDGTVAVFRPLGGGDCIGGSAGARRCAFVAQITEPDGTILSFDYAASGALGGEGGTQRLRQVTSSRGYALLLEGTGHVVTKACVLNLAVTPVPANGLCPANAQATSSYTYMATGLPRLASATGPDNATSSFTYGTSGSNTTTGFVRPGETTPWLVNTLFSTIDEEWSPRDAVSHQSFSDGRSYDYAFGSAPAVADRPQTIAGGSYTDAASHMTSVNYGFPLAPGSGNPGSPCVQQWPPCPPEAPDDFLHYVYQQTSGPILVADALNRTTNLDYCDPVSMAGLPVNEGNRCAVVPLVSFTDPEGITSDLQYDDHRNVTRVTRHARAGSTQPNGQPWPDIVTSAVYDTTHPKSSSKPLSRTDAGGNTTDYTYAPEHGGVLTETGPAVNGVRPQTRHIYALRTAWIANGAGGYVQAAAPVWVQIATSSCRSSAATGNPASPCATAGDEVLVQYDYGPDSGPNTLLLRGQTITATDGGAATSLRTCYTYDALGRRLGETRPNANLTSCPAAQTSAQPYTSNQRYDAAGRVTGTISADPDEVGSGNPLLAVRTTYDAAGRPTKVETGSLASWQSEAVAPSAWGAAFTVARTLETSYDGAGRKVRDTVREGAAGTIRALTQYSYDSLGRLECTAVRMNEAQFGGTLPGACTQAGGAIADRISRAVYDAAGQRLQLRVGVGTPDEGASATWAYNLNGQVTTLIDGNGNRAELRYDGFGRQDRWTFPSLTRPASFNDATQASALASAGSVNAGDYEAYATDPAGNRTSLRKRDGSTLSYSYDALGRMTVKTVPERTTGAQALTAAQTRDVFYGYDNRGLQTFARFDSTSGEGITNVYDGFGRLASTSTNMGGTTRTLSYAYDRDGARTAITHPDGIWFGTWHDGLDRPFYLNANGGTGITYANFAAAGPLTAQWRNGTAELYSYDGVQRLSSLYLYTTESAGQANWNYTRNAAGGVATLTRDNDAYAWTGAYPVTRQYGSNGLNQYDSINSSGGATLTLAYDANGNLSGDGSNTYVYDVENRLVRQSGGHDAALAYDPLGRLWQVTSPTGAGAVTTTFLYDGDALVADYNGAAMLHRYAHWEGADVPMIAYNGATLDNPRNLLSDHQGSIVTLSDANGNATVNRYDEYGIPAATNTGRFQYTGQVWLSELGLYSYKSRLYSPTLGRFMQTDPIGYADQFNLYTYVGDDPVNHADPTGTEKTCDDHGICTITADNFNSSRSNGDTVRLNGAQGEQAVRDRGNFSANGTDEKIGFGFGSQRGETRTAVSPNASTGRGGRVYDFRSRSWITTVDTGRAAVPNGATWAQHGHIEGSSGGMADSTRGGGGLGDSQPLTREGGRMPNVVVSDGRVGVREIVNGQLQHRMLLGTLSGAEAEAIQNNLNSEQSLFYTPR